MLFACLLVLRNEIVKPEARGSTCAAGTGFITVLTGFSLFVADWGGATAPGVEIAGAVLCAVGGFCLLCFLRVLINSLGPGVAQAQDQLRYAVKAGDKDEVRRLVTEEHVDPNYRYEVSATAASLPRSERAASSRDRAHLDICLPRTRLRTSASLSDFAGARLRITARTVGIFSNRKIRYIPRALAHARPLVV